MKKILYFLIPLIIIAALAYFYLPNSLSESSEIPITTNPQRGLFEVKVSATGELKAKNSVKIKAPSAMQQVGVYRTTITRILDEGTTVKEGDWVASLDKTSLQDKANEINIELEKLASQLLQEKIDTTIELSSLRDQLVDLRFTQEEKKIFIEQSKYEAQMVVRQAQLDYDRAERNYGKTENNYKLKQRQAKAKIAEKLTSIAQERNKLAKITNIMGEFDISAPKDGMIIYVTSWNGDKKGEGSEVQPWNNSVAELPDLSSIISKTFVNEVDINKIKVGQSVDIKIDAFPEKAYEGVVTSVANIGQKLRGQDAKVFEVTVQLTTQDSILRPAMSSSNHIISYQAEEAISVPLESLIQDSLTYVRVKSRNGDYLQEIHVSNTNDDFARVRLGLEGSEEIYLLNEIDLKDIETKSLSFEEKNKVDQEIVKEQKLELEALNKSAGAFKKQQTKPSRDFTYKIK